MTNEKSYPNIKNKMAEIDHKVFNKSNAQIKMTKSKNTQSVTLLHDGNFMGSQIEENNGFENNLSQYNLKVTPFFNQLLTT